METKIIPLNIPNNLEKDVGWPTLIRDALHEKVKNLPFLLSAKDLEEIIPVNRTAIYDLFKRPDFPKIKIGQRLMTPTHLFFQFIENEARKSS